MKTGSDRLLFDLHTSLGQVWTGLGKFSLGVRMGLGEQHVAELLSLYTGLGWLKTGSDRRRVDFHRFGIGLDRFGQVWASCALVFVQVWDRLEQV